MNREIKFRAWDAEQSEMFPNIICAGNLVIIEVDPEEWEDGNLVPTFWTDDNNKAGFKVMQFTGLKDKNGVEIYEGDIVKTKSGFICKIVFGLVSEKSSDGIFEYTGFTLHNIKQCKNYHLDNDPIDVIGNIYENPELIK